MAGPNAGAYVIPQTGFVKFLHTWKLQPCGRELRRFIPAKEGGLACAGDEAPRSLPKFFKHLAYICG